MENPILISQYYYCICAKGILVMLDETRTVHFAKISDISLSFHGIMRKITKEITGKEYFAYSGRLLYRYFLYTSFSCFKA